MHHRVRLRPLEAALAGLGGSGVKTLRPGGSPFSSFFTFRAFFSFDFAFNFAFGSLGSFADPLSSIGR